MNLMSGPDDFCRSMTDDLSVGLADAIDRELAKEPPNGALSKPYSRELWDKYWNHRIFHVWDVGPNSCNGTYTGSSGSELIRSTIEKRRSVGLPPIKIEERNSGKTL